MRVDPSALEPPELTPERLERYAELIVELGANVQPGQILDVRASVEHGPLARAIARGAYQRGARFVDVRYFDAHVRRARLVGADPGTLGFVPSWDRERVRQLGEQRCARIGLLPYSDPSIYADLDPDLTAREPYPALPEYLQIVHDRTTNWSAAVAPFAAWAQRVHPTLEPGEALSQLWDQVAHVCRLDEPDPRAAWEERLADLAAVRERLNGAQFDALRFVGPGTDLTVGLFPSSLWDSGFTFTRDGIRHLANIPTEEVFTGPDPHRTEGTVTSTRPLQLKTGTLVEGLVVRFEGGRASSIEARRGAAALRSLCASDEGSARLGEVALVDREGRVGRLGTVFHETLLDENAASHVAFGMAYPETVGPADRPRANRSSQHIDFMIGGDDVDVIGLTRDGGEVPVLRGGIWQL